ncbi:MAG: nickel-dependent hydrogenase large subunit [Nitrosomonadales bacterium]|nr:nickel-dependent hydrogenase large subunit [Nitrosomonadales bacterium]
MKGVAVVDAGRLSLGLVWDGESVAATEIRSTRPLAAQVLKGRTPSEVVQIVPLLFSVCGRAQGAAASAALLAAMREQSPAIATMEHAIVCEALQEHLWRVMLDWPDLLGIPQQDQYFAGWYALLRQIGAGEAGMADFLQGFERDGLGMSAAEWRGLDSYAAVQAWWRKSAGALARPLAKLDEMQQSRNGRNEPRLLPAWSAAEAQQACAVKWDTNFSAYPHWLGAAAETGAWSYHPEHPLLRDVWQQSGSQALTRVLARIVDAVEMASGAAAPRLDMASPAADEGVAAVRTARGLLLHHVRLDGDTVADYQIVAPTEWNFHPAGAFAQGICGLQEHDGGLLEYRAQIEALSLDPCVAYEVEIKSEDGRL